MNILLPPRAKSQPPVARKAFTPDNTEGFSPEDLDILSDILEELMDAGVDEQTGHDLLTNAWFEGATADDLRAALAAYLDGAKSVKPAPQRKSDDVVRQYLADRYGVDASDVKTGAEASDEEAGLYAGDADAWIVYGFMPNTNEVGWFFAGWTEELMAEASAKASRPPSTKSDPTMLLDDLPPTSRAAFEALLPLHNALVAEQAASRDRLAEMAAAVDIARHALELALAEDRIDRYAAWDLLSLYGDRQPSPAYY